MKIRMKMIRKKRNKKGTNMGNSIDAPLFVNDLKLWGTTLFVGYKVQV